MSQAAPHSSPQPTWVQSHFSRVWLFATPWTVACQAPLFIGFSRQEYWSAPEFFYCMFIKFYKHCNMWLLTKSLQRTQLTRDHEKSSLTSLCNSMLSSLGIVVPEILKFKWAKHKLKIQLSTAALLKAEASPEWGEIISVCMETISFLSSLESGCIIKNRT